MFFAIIVAIIIVAIMLKIYYEYLVWSNDYNASAKYDKEKKNSALYKLTAPQSVCDTAKVVNFWVQYTAMQYF